MSKLNNMQSFLSRLLNKNKKSASTAILFVSFFVTFCVYPYAELNESSDAVAAVAGLYAARSGLSRTLLATTIADAPSILVDSMRAANQTVDGGGLLSIYNYFTSLI
jgi:hypothetical protein